MLAKIGRGWDSSLTCYPPHHQPLRAVWWEYPAVQMEEWTQYLPRLLDSPTAANSHIYICVHCPVEERSPINARYFHEILAKSGIDLPPLPPAVDRDLPTQLSLF